MILISLTYGLKWRKQDKERKRVVITIGRLKELLPAICDRETSQDPEGWTLDNPLWGHCAIITLIVQDYFGGELLRSPLKDVPGFSQGASHYWNKLPDGTEIDLTADQFGGTYPTLPPPIIRTKEYVLSYPDTAKRYTLLKLRLEELLKDKEVGMPQTICCNECRREHHVGEGQTVFHCRNCGRMVVEPYKGRFHYCDTCALKLHRCWMCGNRVSPDGSRISGSRIVSPPDII